MNKSVHILILMLSYLLCISCYQAGPYTSDAISLTKAQIDSISFYTTHHYTENYNFVVRADSLELISQHPTEYINGLTVDTFTIHKGDIIVVADITTMPTDSIDSVWVCVARDELAIGWVHENELLPCVSPRDPISRFIDIFSDTHLLVGLAILVLAAVTFVIRRLMRRQVKIVHFNDIDSPYPTAFCLLISSSAVFYSTIQIVSPESWRHFYYHPTLNPFAVPLHIGLFLASVWAIIIMGIATVDDVLHRLRAGEAIFYFLGLACVSAVVYIVFSIFTLYYVGYVLLLLYFVVAITKR